MNREKSVLYTDRPCYTIALLVEVYEQGKTTPLFPKINVVGCSFAAG